MRASDDRDHVMRAAKEALTWPDDYSSSDPRWYHTHAPVCSITRDQRGSDHLAESNYHAALDMLRGAVAHDESGASEARGDDVVETSMGHWGYGYVDVVMVRVYVSDDWADQPEDAREFTPAFLEAVDIAAALENYPVLDESDLSEREYAAWQDTFSEAFDYAGRSYQDDTPAEVQAVWHLMTGALIEYGSVDRISPDGYRPESLDWDAVARWYRELRDELFTSMGAAILAGIEAHRETAARAAGQYPLPGL